MFDAIRTLIWYSVLLVLLLVVYNLGTSYTVAVVDKHFHEMAPTIEAGSTLLLDRSRSALRSIDVDDVIAYKAHGRDKIETHFGRVLATPGNNVSLRGNRLLVDGREVADAASGMSVLETGLIVPSEMVFVVFDASRARAAPVAERLIPYRNIIGRVTSK